MLGYVCADLWRNPRRTFSTIVGVCLGVGLFCGVLFFIDGLSGSMTQRSVAALTVDMQRIVQNRAGGGVELHQTVRDAASRRLSTVVLRATNPGRYGAAEVTIRSAPQDGSGYQPGSLSLDGRPLRHRSTDNPLSSGSTGAGLNIGRVPAGTERRLVYQVSHPAGEQPRILSTISTRESVNPSPANRPSTVPLAKLAGRLSGIDGVAGAEPLSIGVLEDAALEATGRTAPGSGRIFGFDASYADRDRHIRLVDGSWQPGGAVVSAEAASELAISVGDEVNIALPDGSQLVLPVSGTADFSAARALFSSRRGGDLETFQYVPLSVAVSSDQFATEVQPAYERALRRRADYKTPPVREVDITLNREALDADPATALAETRTVASTIGEVAPYQGDYLLDNISNTLSVAADDAITAKRLFIFLGAPGALLAAILAAYAGNVLAEAQRREQAILRIRGASRRQLLRMLAWRAGLVTAAGSVVGLALGYGATRQLLGSDALARARGSDLLTSAAIGTTFGFLATGLALYITARRSLDREINEDRARLAQGVPFWRRWHLDMAMLGAVFAGTVVAARAGAFDGSSGSVYFGRAVDLQIRLLVLPLAVWVSGALLAARLVTALLHRSDPESPARLRPLVPRLTRLSTGRRPWPIATAAAVLALVVSLTTALAGFTASYDDAKRNDALFATGADVRITQSPAAAHPLSAADSHKLTSAPVPEATPVIFSSSNVVLTSARTSDPANLAAVDPAGYEAIAPLRDEHFTRATASAAMTRLRDDPTAILLSEEMAGFLKVKQDDRLDVLLARATPRQAKVPMHVVGLFTRLPGFPEGADALINLTAHTAAVPSKDPDFFLADASYPTDAALDAAVSSLRTGPQSDYDLRVDTRATTLRADQSSLAALNVGGLVALDSGFALAMATVASGIFVFGLLLHRRREYVTLRAQGVSARSIRALIGSETAAVALAGVVAGVAIGVVMGAYFVQVLRPLFVLSPSYVVPTTALTLPTGVALAASGLSAVLASVLVQRLKPVELLRDD